MRSIVIPEPDRCDWTWESGTVARKCVRPPGHEGNHIGFWTMPPTGESAT